MLRRGADPQGMPRSRPATAAPVGLADPAQRQGVDGAQHPRHRGPAERRRAPPPAGRPAAGGASTTRAAATTAPHSGSGRPTTHAARTPGCAASTRSTAAGATFSPAGDDDVVGPAEHLEPAVHPAAEVAGAELAAVAVRRRTRRRSRRGVEVAGRQRRAAEHDRGRRRRGGPAPRPSGTPVVDAAPGRLGHPVGRDDPHPGRLGARPQARRRAPRRRRARRRSRAGRRARRRRRRAGAGAGWVRGSCSAGPGPSAAVAAANPSGRNPPRRSCTTGRRPASSARRRPGRRRRGRRAARAATVRGRRGGRRWRPRRPAARRPGARRAGARRWSRRSRRARRRRARASACGRAVPPRLDGPLRRRRGRGARVAERQHRGAAVERVGDGVDERADRRGRAVEPDDPHPTILRRSAAPPHVLRAGAQAPRAGARRGTPEPDPSHRAPAPRGPEPSAQLGAPAPRQPVESGGPSGPVSDGRPAAVGDLPHRHSVRPAHAVAPGTAPPPCGGAVLPQRRARRAWASRRPRPRGRLGVTRAAGTPPTAAAGSRPRRPPVAAVARPAGGGRAGVGAARLPGREGGSVRLIPAG